jgi:hypothetical protein
MITKYRGNNVYCVDASQTISFVVNFIFVNYVIEMQLNKKTVYQLIKKSIIHKIDACYHASYLVA